MKLSVRTDLPSLWHNVLLFVAIGKCAVAGAGLALALLGVADLASVIGARDFFDAFKQAHATDAFALVGGVIGGFARMIWAIISR